MRRSSRRGFTLVELMVSLVAGLIIAIAVVGLARAATNTFYEQARLTGVEQTVRTAANRLRYDLTKVSFMGTGNIHLATLPNIPYGHQVASQYMVAGGAGGRYVGSTENLQGIHIVANGSTAVDAQVLAFGGAPNFTMPDQIDIGGNMTTDDWYIGKWDTTGAGTCGGGTFIMRPTADPATERLVAGGVAANVTNAFTPGPAGTRHLARVVDSLGCQHYVQIESAGMSGANAIVNLCNAGDTMSLLPPGKARPGCGAIENIEETLRISPFQRVRWRIAQNTPGFAALNPPAAIAPANSTFMLYREVLDAAGEVIPTLTQIVAEYAVDLKFGIAVDARETAAPPNNITVFDLDSPPANIDAWTKNASGTTLTTAPPTSPGPQRVRSVKFRVSTRAPLPDRNGPLAIIPSSPYITRYCIDMPTCTKFSRVRTIVSEVPLINQARMTY